MIWAFGRSGKGDDLWGGQRPNNQVRQSGRHQVANREKRGSLSELPQRLGRRRSIFCSCCFRDFIVADDGKRDCEGYKAGGQY